MKKLISLALMAVVLVSSILPVSAATIDIINPDTSGDTVVNCGVSETYTITIPTKIMASGADSEINVYDVVVENAVIPYRSTLRVSPVYDGLLKLETQEKFTLAYELWLRGEDVPEGEERVDTKINTGDFPMNVPAASSATTFKIYSKVTGSPQIAGIYKGTITFRVGVTSTTYYSDEDISANASLYAIGATAVNNVIAEISEDKKEMFVTKNSDSGDGVMQSWLEFTGVDKALITKVIVKSGVTNIGAGFASGMSSLTTVELPDTITTIGDEAFAGCVALKTITIPESVTSIGTDVFSSLETINGVAGSYAETYATENGYTFVALTA